ncbi:hypothetical protein C8Q77DRAFT_1063421 [Trametes polyzona]|nr:hypothetical protein C8Q77DRAFT_1063421 [Trametes polyzona]
MSDPTVSTAPFSELPIDLLRLVGMHTSFDSLLSLLATSKTFNKGLTPILYAEINLSNYYAAAHCVRTLSRESSTLAFGRNLALLVRSFHIRYQRYRIQPVQKVKVARRLLRAIEAMTNLRHFVLDATFLGPPKLIHVLGARGAHSLRLLSLRLQSERWWLDGSTPDMLLGLRPVFQALTSLTFKMWDEEICWHDVMKHIHDSRAAHLRTLDLAMTGPAFHSFVQDSLAWSSLQELTLRVTGDIPFALLPATPNVRTLRLTSDDLEPTDTALPSDALPKLEVLVCPHQALPLFLPEDAPRQRPIRVVQLNGASYGEDNEDFSYVRWERCKWEDVRRSLRCIPRSAGPVTELSIYVDWFDAKTFGGGIAECVQEVEQLVIVLNQDPGNEAAIGDWSKTLFAHAPKLHTFLLSNAPYKWNDTSTSFLFATQQNKQLAWLAAWDKNPNTLKRVAFTTEFFWIREEDGWRALRGFAERTADSEDEDDDDDEYSSPVQSDGSAEADG